MFLITSVAFVYNYFTITNEKIRKVMGQWNFVGYLSLGILKNSGMVLEKG